MIVPRIHSRRAMLAAAALATLVILAIGAGTAEAAGPVVKIEGGVVCGATVPGGYAFSGLPYCAFWGAGQ